MTTGFSIFLAAVLLALIALACFKWLSHREEDDFDDWRNYQ